MGNSQHKSPQSSVSGRRKSSISSITGAIPRIHKKNSSSNPQEVDENHAAAGTSSKISRSASGTDITEKNYSLFIPTEKLAKILQQKTLVECGIDGIDCNVFAKYVFPQYPDLGCRFFKYIHKLSKARTAHLGATAFRQQCEHYLSILDDALVMEQYIKMYCGGKGSESDNNEDDYATITQKGLSELLTVCYKISMSNYSCTINDNSSICNQLSSSGEYMCPYLNRTIQAVSQSCYFTKDALSSGFVCRWLEQHCSRLVLPMHRYCVHTITTVYRSLEENAVNKSEKSRDDSEINQQKIGLELATPLLDNLNGPFDKNTDDKQQPFKLLPLSQAWLLAGALPAVYTLPQQAPVHSKDQQNRSQQQTSTETDSKPVNPADSIANASSAFMSRLLSIVPSHWTMLYNSQNHGVGANRFLHHVLGYRGPTLCLLRTNNDELYCISASSEWRETHLYTGDKDCHIMQLLPKFSVLEKGSKLLYLNTSLRGYPKGLRAGPDPRKPLLAIDEHFEKLDYRGVSSVLLTIEVWGCGDKQSRDVQLDIKKWQIKEAERQRTVKLTAADWMDHPDRYLLELGGRPQYNNAN